MKLRVTTSVQAILHAEFNAMTTAMNKANTALNIAMNNANTANTANMNAAMATNNASMIANMRQLMVDREVRLCVATQRVLPPTSLLYQVYSPGAPAGEFPRENRGCCCGHHWPRGAARVSRPLRPEARRQSVEHVCSAAGAGGSRGGTLPRLRREGLRLRCCERVHACGMRAALELFVSKRYLVEGVQRAADVAAEQTLARRRRRRCTAPLCSALCARVSKHPARSKEV